MDLPTDQRVAAAGNNAWWCEAVCRGHGALTTFHPYAWVSATRTPAGYPDAVTLYDRVDADTLLGQVDASPGCSVKDSFAALDLAADGFTVLFRAEWIHRPAGGSAGRTALRWQAVDSPAALRHWALAHGGGDVFHPALLADPSVVVLAAHDGAGRLAAGVVGNHTGAMVGLSNLFAVTADPHEAWTGAVAALSARFPGLPLVGYEQGDDLAAARRAGFRPAGDLCVWLKPGEAMRDLAAR